MFYKYNSSRGKINVFPISDYSNVKNFVIDIYDMYEKQSILELKNMIETLIKWCECENDADCKILINQISIEKDIF